MAFLQKDGDDEGEPVDLGSRSWTLSQLPSARQGPGPRGLCPGRPSPLAPGEAGAGRAGSRLAPLTG